MVDAEALEDRSGNPKCQRAVDAEGQHDHQELELGFKAPFV